MAVSILRNSLVIGVALTCATAYATRAQKPGNPDASRLKNPVEATQESIAAGKQTYQKYCRFCHGPEGKGDGSMAPEGTHPSNLVDDKWDRGSSDGEIFAVIRDGAGPKFDMKGFKNRLSEQDMWNVVNYLRSIGPQSKSR